MTSKPAERPSTLQFTEHQCEGLLTARSDARYRAIQEVWTEDGGSWFAGNSEYQTPVKFCPFCGEKL